jgi:C-methyltransferase-like protein/putative zinc binding protein/methyltransferase family protein
MISAPAKSMSTSALTSQPYNVCISCGAKLQTQLFDFGAMPISNSLLRSEDIGKGELFYPLRVMACEACSLVQLTDRMPADAHFHREYVYFSSYSKYWLKHCETYVEAMIERFALRPGEQILEVGSNDGYLLRFFQQRGLSVLGVEPSESVARAAIAKGIPTQIRFFGAQTGRELAASGVRPRLIAANNVFAHVPHLNDFTEGFAALLAEDAILTAEVHYFRDLYENTEFDSFYHEHYSYYTIRAADHLFSRHGLRLFDVERLPSHGGSIRLFVCRKDASFVTTDRLNVAIAEDDAFFHAAIAKLHDFGDRVFEICDTLRHFLVNARRQRTRTVGFGAPAKACTLLNFASITTDLLSYTVDSNPSKQGRFLPGVHLPIFAPDVLLADRPDHVLVLPWNLRSEITEQLSILRTSGTRFVCAIPKFEIF